MSRDAFDVVALDALDVPAPVKRKKRRRGFPATAKLVAKSWVGRLRHQWPTLRLLALWHFADVLAGNTVEDGDCVIWTGRGVHGIPQIDVFSQRINVRLLVLKATGTKVFPGRMMCVACNTPMCVALDHIRQRDHAQNGAAFAKLGAYSDVTKIRKMALTKRANSKLNAEKIAAIRASDRLNEDLAAEYGVSKSYISGIKTGIAWKSFSSPLDGLGAR